jgi:hypothetical protein
MYNRGRGLSQVITTIMLTVIAIALALAVAMYVFNIVNTASTKYGVRVIVNGPYYSNGSVVFTVVNTGRDVVEIPYIEINNELLSAGNRCLVMPGSYGVLTLIGNDTYITSARFVVNGCIEEFGGIARLYGVNSILIPITNGQVFMYTQLQFNS